ncbi:MAG: NTP transferase domain-containing protein [Candidatus Eisenbacteria sp.]|nr:NTP transferase domain-containing protein [Candidatus Eisenbacteria bacterium]
MTLDILLLAAGLGTRLRPLTEQIPKALLPVCGSPLLDIHLDHLFSFGTETIRRVVVNGHHLADQVENHLRKWAPDKGSVRENWLEFSFEPKIRGTGGALVQAAPWLDSDPFVVMNADVCFQAPIVEAIAFHRERRHAATMVLVPSPVWPNVLVVEGRVSKIVREGPVPDGFTFTGLHIVSQEVLDLLPGKGFHDIRDSYQHLLQRGRLGAFIWSPRDLTFVDIGTPESYLEAHRLCAGHRRPGDPAHALQGAAGVTGYGFVHPTATIGAGAEIISSVVLANAVVAPGIRVQHAVLGPGVTVAESVEHALVTTRGTRRIDP